jgi:hypothetical protein
MSIALLQTKGRGREPSSPHPGEILLATALGHEAHYPTPAVGERSTLR